MNRLNKFIDKSFSFFWLIFPLFALVAVLQIAAAENPAVMERARATVDNNLNNSPIPFKILRQGQNSFYGADALFDRDAERDFRRPKIFVADNDAKFVQLWKKYVDPDCVENALNPLGDKVAIFIFRGAQDSDLYTVKLDGARLLAPASGPIIVDVTFNNPNHKTYSFPKKFCSPFIVLTVNNDHLNWLGKKKVRVFVQEVSHTILDAEEMK